MTPEPPITPESGTSVQPPNLEAATVVTGKNYKFILFFEGEKILRLFSASLIHVHPPSLPTKTKQTTRDINYVPT